MPSIPTIIALPPEESRQEDLKNHLAKERGKFSSIADKGLQMPTICAIALLTRLLEDRMVDTGAVKAMLIEEYAGQFDERAYNQACFAIYETTVAPLADTSACGGFRSED